MKTGLVDGPAVVFTSNIDYKMSSTAMFRRLIEIKFANPVKC